MQNTITRVGRNSAVNSQKKKFEIIPPLSLLIILTSRNPFILIKPEVTTKHLWIPILIYYNCFTYDVWIVHFVTQRIFYWYQTPKIIMPKTEVMTIISTFPAQQLGFKCNKLWEDSKISKYKNNVIKTPKIFLLICLNFFWCFVYTKG